MRDLLSSTDRHRETFSSPLSLSLSLSLSRSVFRPLFLFLPPLVPPERSAATPPCAPPNLQPSPGSRLFEDYESFRGRATAPSYAPTITGTPAPNSPPFKFLRRGIPNANILSLSLARLEFFASYGDFIFDEESPRSAAYNLQIEYA